MWIKTPNGLVQSVDESRQKLRVRINMNHLNELRDLANRYNTNLSYLIENGLINMFNDTSHEIVGSTRTKGNKEVGLTIDFALIEKMKLIAQEKKVKMTTIISNCIPYIKPEEAKKENYRYRVES
nr:hypothetical protein [Lysinibacillus timonensis]